jgi:hypothetical protein
MHTTHGVFVYGSLTHPDELRALLGHQPLDGDAKRVTLRGFSRSWRVCTDNTDPDRAVTYLDSEGAPPRPIQVLFVTVLPDPGGTVEGLLLRLTAEQLTALDLREGNYVRRNVTDAVPNPGDGPDVIWTYVAKPSQVARADAGLAAGTACIRRDYLDRLSTLEREAPLPNVPVIALIRVLRT